MAYQLKRTSPPGMPPVHVGDCYIWSEIHYLDSSTDYREFLPVNGTLPTPVDNLVMLDSSEVNWPGVVGTLLVFLAGIAGTGWLTYLALSGY